MISLAIEKTKSDADEQSLVVLASSHTLVEHRLYTMMLHSLRQKHNLIGSFSLQNLRTMAGVRSAATIQSAVSGLIGKLSIEELNPHANGNARLRLFQVFHPQEIFARRYVAALQNGKPSNGETSSVIGNEEDLRHAVSKTIKHHHLSCREAEVALYCIEGLTNAQIARRLNISEPTVKFHLRNLFSKCGVKRRAELVSHILMPPHSMSSSAVSNDAA